MGEKFHNELLIYTLAVLNTVQFGVYPGVSTYMGKKSFFLPFVTFMTHFLLIPPPLHIFYFLKIISKEEPNAND